MSRHEALKLFAVQGLTFLWSLELMVFKSETCSDLVEVQFTRFTYFSICLVWLKCALNPVALEKEVVQEVAQMGD